ncbi:MAG TPA: DinB family protein [Candidatus Eisenbacteria bacterium]|jgi:uncharacterized damage-inducible protein DinB
MIDVRAVQELYRYNRWANARVFEAISGLAPDPFTRDLGSSHPSLRDTVTHIVWAEWLYLQRWKGTSPRTVFPPSDFPRPGDLKARWLAIELDLRAFVESVTAERLLDIVRYVNRQGETWEYPLWRQMVHLVNHSSYHRGQVATMLRQLQVQPVATDFLLYHDELSQ